MQVPIVLNRRARTPLHRQIYDQWRDGILAGRFGPGERVPSTRELADLLRVARSTVATAYDQLMAEGYLQAERGSGSFVVTSTGMATEVGHISHMLQSTDDADTPLTIQLKKLTSQILVIAGAAVAVSVVNALEQMRHVRAIYETAPAPVVATAVMQPAQ